MIVRALGGDGGSSGGGLDYLKFSWNDLGFRATVDALTILNQIMI